MMMQHVLSHLIFLVEQTLQFQSGWTMYSARDQKKFWMTVVFQDGGLTTVIIASMMLGLCVQTVSEFIPSHGGIDNCWCTCHIHNYFVVKSL